MQHLLTLALVAGCFVYALWTLGPKAPRQRLAAAVLAWQLPLPAMLSQLLAAAARPASGCGGGCKGCEQAPSTGVKPMLFVRKR